MLPNAKVTPDHHRQFSILHFSVCVIAAWTTYIAGVQLLRSAELPFNTLHSARQSVSVGSTQEAAAATANPVHVASTKSTTTPISQPQSSLVR